MSDEKKQSHLKGLRISGAFYDEVSEWSDANEYLSHDLKFDYGRLTYSPPYPTGTAEEKLLEMNKSFPRHPLSYDIIKPEGEPLFLVMDVKTECLHEGPCPENEEKKMWSDPPDDTV